MTTLAFDQARAEAFGDKIVGIMIGGSLSLMVSVGHRTGLFDKLSELPPSTGNEIAKATGLNERYVREWLGGMVTGGLIDYDPASANYHLPAEHAGFLTRAGRDPQGGRRPDQRPLRMQEVAIAYRPAHAMLRAVSGWARG
jgi:hypothetical protein